MDLNEERREGTGLGEASHLIRRVAGEVPFPKGDVKPLRSHVPSVPNQWKYHKKRRDKGEGKGFARKEVLREES